MTSYQFKLMGALMSVIVLVVAVSGALAERSLREREMERVARSLTARAQLVVALSESTPFGEASIPQLDAIADRAGAAAHARVTILDAEGTVLGDSNVALEQIPEVVNHADRPEVRAALQGEVGQSARRSKTVGRRLFYLAVPARGGSGVVRLAVDLSDMEAAVWELRWELFVAAAIGLLAAIAISYPLTSITLRPVRETARVVASIAGGDLEHRLPLRWRDELGEISISINRMAEQLHERLEETTSEKERLQAVLNGMVEGVMVVDAEGSIVLANQRLRDFFDVHSEVEGKTPLETFRDAGLEEILAEAATGQGPVFRELEIDRREPRVLRVHAVSFPAGATRMGSVAVAHDITEIRRLEQFRQDFVANASHELRTPLAAIRGFAETLLGGEGLSEEERSKYVAIIDRHAGRLGNLVSDLLELSKIEAGAVEVVKSDVDLNALVRILLSDYEARLTEAGLEASSTLTGPSVAWGDQQSIEQIVTNLVDNAIHYTNRGGRIDIQVEGKPDRVWVHVQDTGIGIPAGDRERIFERFYRVDKSRSRAQGGTGLGLSIVKHLVQSMGGGIRVESTPGRGSTFSFWIPRRAEEA